MSKIVQSRIQQGDLVAVAAGTLGLSAQGRLDGELQMTVAGIEKVIPALGIEKMLDEGVPQATLDRIAPGVKSQDLNNLFGALDRAIPGLGKVVKQNANVGVAAGINALGKEATLEGKKARAFPLRFVDGAVFLGPLKVGQNPAAVLAPVVRAKAGTHNSKRSRPGQAGAPAFAKIQINGYGSLLSQTAHASVAAELHLAVDCNPRRSSHGQQRSGFTIGGGLGNAFAAVAADLPGRDDAAFSRARPCLDPCRHPTQQDRRPVEAAALPVVRGSIARGTIERRPEKFGRDQAVLRRQGRIRCPGRREHSRSIPGLTHERSGKNAQAISLRPCRTAHETRRQRMLVRLDRRQQLGCRCLVEACLLQARKFNTRRSSSGDDRGAIAKLP